MLETNSENVLGATIFFSYIVAALFFTGLISRDLVRLYNQSRYDEAPSGKPETDFSKRREQARILIALSGLSFATLSFQMLSFLIASYAAWSRISQSFAYTDLATKSFFSSHGWNDFLSSVWVWSKRSTLFQDFAVAIVGNDAGFWWTQQALLYSMVWNSYMIIEGIRCRIPHLWAYFVLDQILPISFTQNLFSTAILLSHNPHPDGRLHAAAAGTQFAVVFSYLLSLSIAPRVLHAPSFFFLLFTVRALLFVPYWALRPTIVARDKPHRDSSDRIYWKHKYAAISFVAGGVFLHVKQTLNATPLVSTIKAINSNPAVATLGYDYLIAVFSLMYFVKVMNR